MRKSIEAASASLADEQHQAIRYHELAAIRYSVLTVSILTIRASSRVPECDAMSNGADANPAGEHTMLETLAAIAKPSLCARALKCCASSAYGLGKLTAAVPLAWISTERNWPHTMLLPRAGLSAVSAQIRYPRWCSDSERSLYDFGCPAHVFPVFRTFEHPGDAAQVVYQNTM